MKKIDNELETLKRMLSTTDGGASPALILLATIVDDIWKHLKSNDKKLCTCTKTKVETY